MTIGPEPIMRIFLMSVRLGIPHQLEKLTKQVIRIVWARGCFRMVLHTKRGHRAMLEPFDSIVVQIDMRNRDIVQVQTFRIHCESVILCGDFDLLSFDIKNGMVSAMMSKLQFI